MSAPSPSYDVASGLAYELVNKIVTNDYALRALEAIGKAKLVSGSEGFRGAIRLRCTNNICKFDEDSCSGYVLASVYALGMFKSLLKISARSRPVYTLSDEAYAVVPDRLIYTVPYNYYENLIYVPNVDTPENRFLKFILSSAMKCGTRLNLPKWLINEIAWALKLTWLSKVTEVDRINLAELITRRPHMSSPYNALLEMGGAVRVEALGIEYVHKLFEIYTLGLVIKAIAKAAVQLAGTDVVIDALPDGGLKTSLGNYEVYYQASLAEVCGPEDDKCWVPDIVLINKRGKSAVVIEVKATSYADYLRDGVLQALNYANRLKECLGNTDVRPSVVYYKIINRSISSQLTRCLKGEDVKLVSLDINEDDENKIGSLVSTLSSSS